jgi:signal transduction histidine kinase
MTEDDPSDELAALRRENAILRETLDAIDGTVVVYDAERKFVLANQAYHTFFPHLPPDGELAGKLYEEVLRLSMTAGTVVDSQSRTDPSGYIEKRIHAMDEQDAPPREVRDPRSGKWFMIRVRHTPTANRVALRVEITEQKRLQEALAQAREAAEQASRAKSQFLGLVSHELRTPLNAVINFARLLKEQIHGPLGAPDYHEYAAHILQSGGELLSLIEDVLDLVRADAGQMTLNEQPVNLRGTIFSVKRSLGEKAEQADVALDLDVPPDLPSIQADRPRLWRALTTLLDHAIYRTPLGGSVRIAAHREPDGGVEVVITDGGPTLSAEEMVQQTRPFESVIHGEEGRTGIGLGLPLVDQLIRSHGGALLFEPCPTKGMRARLRLPSWRTLGVGG